MNTFRPGRFVGITAGALVILAVGLYGPATLLGPLPQVTVTMVTPAAPAPAASPPALPANGGSALAEIGTEFPGETGTTTFAAAGTTEAMPMASAAKLITALVVLDEKPLEVGRTGPAVAITAADYQGYLDYANADARIVAVFPGENWTEREMLQALILGSSNNHADTLARWAFGSVDAYVGAANDWLTSQGLTSTRVADSNGLLDASAGSAADLARLAAIAATNPVLGEILADPASALASRRGVENTTAYLPEEGITGISRSYTDAAGVCFLFTGQVGTGDDAFRFAGAFLGEPDYDALTADLQALMATARAGIGEVPLLSRGDAYATFRAPWGQGASGVVRVEKSRLAWYTGAPDTPTVTVNSFSTARAGANVGRVSIDAPGGAVSSPLVLDKPIHDPGPGWRLLNPIPVITALLQSR
jgi:D-alanyl-D-alanine carboxypeptidase (penicillin-binding protein 5/6)